MAQQLESILASLSSHPVLNLRIPFKDYSPIDLSIANKQLKLVDVSSATQLSNYIFEFLEMRNAKVAYGGYLEERSIYNRSSHFKNTKPELVRNIHLGLDLWLEAGAAIYTPLDAIVHSFKNNTNYGDYGPTIILEHIEQGIRFYSLYGHLSLESVEGIEVGQEFKKGAQIATLGDASINGDYPPHLHFQIIKDLQGFVGDYPGVCSQQDLEFYEENCPDPNLLLQLK